MREEGKEGGRKKGGRERWIGGGRKEQRIKRKEEKRKEEERKERWMAESKFLWRKDIKIDAQKRRVEGKDGIRKE